MRIRIVKLNKQHKNWVNKLMIEYWGDVKIVSRGKIYYPEKLPGYIALINDELVGLITYHIEKDQWEIITMNSLVEKQGIGTTLLDKVKKQAVAKKCKRLWLITTNDNLDALRFYQKRGFFIKAIYKNAIEVSRRLKPSIPLTGNYGIPIRDEIELEINF